MTAIVASHKHKTFAQRMLICLGLVASAYFLCDGLILLGQDHEDFTMVAYIVCAFLAPAFPFISLIYTWSLFTNRQKFTTTLFALLCIPVSFGFVELFAYLILGFDKAKEYMLAGRMIPADISDTERLFYRIFELVTHDLYIFMVLLGVTALAGFIMVTFWKSDFSLMRLFKFLFVGKAIRPIHVQATCSFLMAPLSYFRMFMGRDYLMSHQNVLVILFCTVAVLFAVIGYLGLHIKSPVIVLGRTPNLPRFNDIPVSIKKIQQEGSEFESEKNKMMEYKNSMIRRDLHALMRDHLCFLYPGMSRFAVASALHISRKRLDKLIQLFYGVTYEQYVSVQRVQYMHRLHVLKPDYSLSELATRCGFYSVASMKRQCKEVLGNKEAEQLFS